MTEDPDRPLSSIELLTGDEPALIDRWSNRPALTEPAPAPVSIPRPSPNTCSAPPTRWR